MTIVGTPTRWIRSHWLLAGALLVLLTLAAGPALRSREVDVSSARRPSSTEPTAAPHDRALLRTAAPRAHPTGTSPSPLARLSDHHGGPIAEPAVGPVGDAGPDGFDSDLAQRPSSRAPPR